MNRKGLQWSPSALRRLLLRFSVAAGLLYFVFEIALPEDGQSVVTALVSAWQSSALEAFGWFLVAFVILGISFAIGALRFHTLLRGASVAVAWSGLFRAYLVAGFFNLVLPGAILGDVYRLWDVKEDAGSGSRALGILIVERLLSLAALGSLGLIAAPFIPLRDADRYLVVILVGLCGAVALGTTAALHPRANPILRKSIHPFGRLSSRIGEGADSALQAVAELGESPRVLLRGFALSLVNQGLPVLAVLVLAEPLAGDPGWMWFAVIVPFVTLVSLVPISIGGTGVREYLYVALFGAVGMPAEAALALSLSVLATAIVWAVVGLLIFVFDTRTESTLAEAPTGSSST